MAVIISIPKPCHEDWQSMSPNEQGRHCDVCSKTVVDFTNSSQQEILFHMQQSKTNLCGRFLPEQLDEPIPTPDDFIKQLHYFRIPLLRKIAAIFLFSFSAFIMSCNDHSVSGKMAIAAVDTPPPIEQLVGDTVLIPTVPPAPLKPIIGKPLPVKCDNQIMGKMVAQPVRSPLQGDIAYIDTSAIPVQNVLVGEPAVYDTTGKK